jgi:glucokinase
MPSRKVVARSPKSSAVERVRGAALSLGIDLGATKVVSALVDGHGTVVRRSERLEHANDGPESVLPVVVRAARQSLDGLAAPPASIGIAVAAQVDPSGGTVVYAPNLRWRDEPLGAPLTKALGTPVRVFNDARAATFAEWKFGAGVGESDLFCLVLGTGVGGSAVVGGSLLEGGTHSAGEVGHLTIVSGGRPCHCPNSGCFEAYVGGWAIQDRAREVANSAGAEGAALRGVAHRGASITAEAVFRAAREGDALARRLVDETERYLADGAVSVVNAFNPSMLVLGGGLVAGRPEWVSIVAAAVRLRCQPAAAGARVVGARLGEDAGVVGAASLARDRAPVAPAARLGARADR